MKSTITISILILSICSFASAASISQLRMQAPILFEQNIGQEDLSVKYFARGPAYKTLLYSTAAQFDFKNENDIRSQLQISLKDSNPNPVIKSFGEAISTINYYIGDNPLKWKTDVPAFGAAIYDDVYPGIDWMFYENQGAVEFDFEAAPGADISRINMTLKGADQIEIDADGNLIASIQGKEFKMLAPVAFQCEAYESGSCKGRSEIESNYKLVEDQIEFQLGVIDRNKTLVIDPKISFGTLLGGNTFDSASDVAVDAKGNFYVVGYTEANTRFPGFGDGYVSKFSPTGALVWSTFLIGSSGEDARAIAVTPAGICFVGGSTSSADFPRVGAFQSNYGGNLDGYVVKLAANGTIMKSSFIGGNGSDAVSGVRLGKGPKMTNGLYIFGTTESRNFPRKNATQNQYGGGRQDGFLAIIHSVQFEQVMSTYVGQKGADEITSLALNAVRGDLYVLTMIADASAEPFIAHLKPKSSGLNKQLPEDLIHQFIARTFALGIWLERTDLIKFALELELNRRIGEAASMDASNPNASASIVLATSCQPQPPATSCNENGSLVFFDQDLNRTSSVNFGGTGPGAYFINDIAIGKDGAIYMVGDTLIKNLPVVNAVQGSNKGSWDGFILKLAPGTFQTTFYSYLGATGSDFAQGVAVDNAGNILVAGSTESKQFPTTPNAPKKKPTGTGDGYVVKITP